jgi:hypothetical protein
MRQNRSGYRAGNASKLGHPGPTQARPVRNPTHASWRTRNARLPVPTWGCPQGLGSRIAQTNKVSQKSEASGLDFLCLKDAARSFFHRCVVSHEVTNGNQKHFATHVMRWSSHFERRCTPDRLGITTSVFYKLPNVQPRAGPTVFNSQRTPSVGPLFL